jgi:hypothetical protein
LIAAVHTRPSDIYPMGGTGSAAREWDRSNSEAAGPAPREDEVDGLDPRAPEPRCETAFARIGRRRCSQSPGGRIARSWSIPPTV